MDYYTSTFKHFPVFIHTDAFVDRTSWVKGGFTYLYSNLLHVNLVGGGQHAVWSTADNRVTQWTHHRFAYSPPHSCAVSLHIPPTLPLLLSVPDNHIAADLGPCNRLLSPPHSPTYHRLSLYFYTWWHIFLTPAVVALMRVSCIDQKSSSLDLARQRVSRLLTFNLFSPELVSFNYTTPPMWRHRVCRGRTELLLLINI